MGLVRGIRGGGRTGDDRSFRWDRRIQYHRSLCRGLVHIDVPIRFTRGSRLHLQLQLLPPSPSHQIRSSRFLDLFHRRRPRPAPFPIVTREVHPPGLFHGQDLFDRLLAPGMFGLDHRVGRVLERERVLDPFVLVDHVRLCRFQEEDQLCGANG